MLPDNPDEQARLFYLVLLGAALAGGIFTMYRDRMGQALQHAAIWGLIFVGVILAIGFKDTLTATLIDDHPQRVSENAVMLERSRDGHFFATLEINDRRIRFLVDTGASDMVLTQKDAERAGFRISDLNFYLRAQTANGTVSSAPVRLDEVRLADFVDRDVSARVNGGDLGISLLGMSYLDRFDGYRVEGDRMFLYR